MTQPLYIQTPLWFSTPLSHHLGSSVYLKMEAFQPVGSFKARGMGLICKSFYDAGTRSVVCSSGGNAGYAVAYASRLLGMSATVVAPLSTSSRSRELILAEGAELIIYGDAWDDAHRHALQLASQEGAAYVHPFDDPLIWEGHSSIVTELADQGTKPGMLVVSVGGGGLLAGLLIGLHRIGWEDVPVLAVETEGTASFAGSIKAGRLITLPAITSIATTLGARTVTPVLMDWITRHEIIPWVVSDRQAVDACLNFASDHRILVEPACGAALAAIYDKAVPVQSRDPVVVIVCGGAGVTPALLHKWDLEVE